ncbi:Male-enhanced antigen 1 [Frankliniella fusca]|uniref:Male-enhanced antigen 1 n=1 Tax=Frankliniella fusca TaxID=407009 RepID=A0AAE1LRW3_9NEOP|nr:Male-enhanced antigen 1 [Frankliniella fusca]
MAPDPPAFPVDEESLPHTYNVAAVDDSDNEVEEQQVYDGYTLLGQHEFGGGAHVNDEDSDVEPEETNQIDNRPAEDETAQLPEAGREELLALWNSTPVGVTSNSITMDDERSAQIRAAMAGFSLPPSAVPAWASSIPEEMWKEKLLDKLQQVTKNSGSTR